jgi:signal transduction histidine kinase
MLPSLPVDEARIYDLRYAEATLPAQLPGGGIDRSSAFWQTLVAGETAVQIYAPDEPATGYTPSAAVHTVGTYTLLPGGQEGKVLLTLSEAPQLTQKMMEARGAGLAITAVTMGLLFADGIIRARGEELALAYQELRRAEAMRDDLTNMIIHDLRTPLTAISASLELLNHLSEQPLGQAEGQIVDRARRAAHRLNSMIGDILAVAKMETGELTPKLEQVVLAELLAERLEVFSVQATVEEKALRVDCPPHLTARLDPALAGRVVENLVNNAFKYTRPGGTIAVAASGSNGVVQVSVRDTGAGIPDEYKEFIFSKFGQIPGEGSESLRKGAGLGLAFCRLVAEAHGGKIWVEDNPGGGSNFVMQVPAG